MSVPSLIPGLVDGAMRLLDRLIPDEAARAEAKRRLLDDEGRRALDEMELRLSAILAEAASSDPWTSRARPAFLYVVYVMLLAALPMGLVAAAEPAVAMRVADGFRAWLAAIPEPIVDLFAVGYLGYAGARTIDKWRAAPAPAADAKRRG